LRLTSFLQDGKLRVMLAGEIDHHCAKEYINAIAAKIEAYVPKTCILDFSEVSFMDSSGIAVIINALRCMKKYDGQLNVCAMREQPRKVFVTSGLDKLINMTEVLK